MVDTTESLKFLKIKRHLFRFFEILYYQFLNTPLLYYSIHTLITCNTELILIFLIMLIC